MKISRRNFVKLSAATAATLAVGAPKALRSAELKPGEKDFSPITGKERKKVPSACWQCVARDGIVAYVEDGRVVKIEGNPELPRTNGVLCAKAQAGMNQVYDPDRIIYPLKRMGERGEGKWKRITWDEALDEVAGKLKELRDKGEPEKFMFHYGRMKASSSKIIKTYFLAAYGTGTIGNHTSVCEGGKWTAQELTWGGHYDNNDVTNTNFIVNFGSNVFETHTNHVPLCQRVVDARNGNNKVRMVTFDVRLSNTAAKSDEWIPIKPGTDLAVILAMTNVVLNEGLYDEDFIETWTNVSVEQLKKHYAKYTPEWASGISGVSAEKIRELALELANAKPGIAMGYRGPIAHYNGNEAERALMTLNAVLGNIDRPGGNCKAVGAGWKNSFKKPKGGKKLHILDGEGVAYPTHHVSHQVFKMIKKAPANERPEIYMWYCYNPVYINGECQENIEVMKSIPYLVAIDIAYSESTALADIILPDATYLERWDWEDMVAPSQVPEYYIRQPAVKPLGEARDFKDVCIELAKRLGIHKETGGFNSAEEFVRDACENTPEVREAGGFEYMKEHGAWYDKKAKPRYYSYKTVVLDVTEEPVEVNGFVYTDLEEPEKVAPHFGDDVLYDQETGVYWHWRKSSAKSREEAIEKGYRWTKNAYKGYVGQKIGDKVYQGFKPDKVNKSGLLEINSPLLEKKGFPGMPTWMPIPEHQNMKSDEIVLTTFKVNVQTHSRTQNCKWLTEIYHNNPGWINPATAAKIGIRDGDRVKVKSKVGEITTFARVTEGIVPGVIAISYHCGHWEYGRYASGKASPTATDSDPDIELKWWKTRGEHPNWIIPNSPDPINGQQRWFDTVVTVSKV